MRAALPFAAGGAAAEGVVSARVVALIQGVLKTMWLTKMTMATALALILAVLGGAGGLVYRSVAAEPGDKPKAAPPKTVADDAKRPEGDTDAEKIQRTWVAVSGERDGKELTPAQLEAFLFVIARDQFAFGPHYLPDVLATYKLDPTKTPKEIELTVLEGYRKGKAMKYLYRLDGDRLTLCFQIAADAPAPTEFATKADSGLCLVHLKHWPRDDAPKDLTAKIIAPATVASTDPELKGELVLTNKGDASVRICTLCNDNDGLSGPFGISRVPDWWKSDGPRWETSAKSVLALEPGKSYSFPFTIRRAQFKDRDAFLITGYYSVSREDFAKKLAVWRGKVEAAPLLVQVKPKEDKPPHAKPAADKSEGKAPDVIAKYKIVAEATQPAGSPILMKLIWTNTGTEPLRYWSSGGDYPGLGLTAKVTDAAGKVRELPRAGDSLTMPAAIVPLPEGVYTVEVNDGSAKVTVKDDAKMFKKREDDLHARIGKGELFAQYVIAAYLTPSLRERLLKDLSVTDSDTAWQAAQMLHGVEKLPTDVVPLLAQAMDKQMALEEARGKRYNPKETTILISYIAEMAGRIGSDEALDAVVKLTHNKMGGPSGIGALGMFKQELALKELHGFLKSTDESQRFAAATTLANRRDPAAVEELLAVIASSQTARGWRAFACLALANYPGDPRVEPAIKTVLSDGEWGDRAKQALEQLHAAQKK